MKRLLNKVYYVAFVAVAVRLNLESTINSTTVSVRLICRKLRLTNLHGHNETVALENKMICNSY